MVEKPIILGLIVIVVLLVAIAIIKRKTSKRPPASFFIKVAKELGHNTPFTVQKVNGKWVATPTDGRKYVLNVITKHEDGGYSSHWHGWSSKWLFTRSEAEIEKSKIQHLYHDVEIIEHTS